MTRIQEPVIKYMQENAGRIVTTAELVGETGYRRAQVQGALSHLANKGLIARRAQSMYVYLGNELNGNNSNPLFEQIATTKNGDLVLQDEAGDVVVARVVQ